MTSHQVFVIWKHPLFHESVRLLLKHPDVNLVGSSSDYTNAYEQIQSLQPDTILMEAAEKLYSDEVVKLLESCPWSLRVMLISLGDNQLSMYYREQKTVGKVDDLLHLIISHEL